MEMEPKSNNLNSFIVHAKFISGANYALIILFGYDFFNKRFNITNTKTLKCLS